VKRHLLVLVALLTLGCSGLTEWTFEATTGGTMELTEDGMVMVMEDGTEVTTLGGEDVEIPDDFPIPEPWADAKAVSVVITENPDGETFTMVTYELQNPTDEVMERYDTWLETRGATDIDGVDETAMGMRTVLRVAKDSHEETPILITVSEFFGQDTVNLGYGKGPKNAEI